MSNLTLGDFIVVRKKAEILNKLNKQDELLEMLVAECSVKENQGNRIGFAL
jgi:chaperonin cofactor prefoldin